MVRCPGALTPVRPRFVGLRRGVEVRVLAFFALECGAGKTRRDSAGKAADIHIGFYVGGLNTRD